MIRIQNKLEILRGNKILVPGCEPTSAFTSPTLAENRDCKASVVDLADAIKAIPDATIEMWGNPRTRFFVLPSGPAPSPQKCTNCSVQPDYYQLLRDIGEPTEVDNVISKKCPADTPTSVGQICSAFSFKGVFG
jgi:hypothetical protein